MEAYKYLELTIEYVFRANFNDSYYLETLYISLEDLNKDELVWIDPYNGRSKIKNTLIAIKQYSNEEYIILEKKDKGIVESKKSINSVYICCEDFDESVLLTSNIQFRKSK